MSPSNPSSPLDAPVNAPIDAHIDALEDELTRIAGHINAIDYYFLKLLADFDERHGWCGDGIKSYAHWLNWKCGLGALEAREKVRVARSLRELPQITEAFRTGEISYSKVRAMTRVATSQNEDALLHIARYGTAAHIEKLVRSYRRCRNLNEDKDLADYYRSFSYGQDDDGMYVFRGRLPADEGELVARALRHLWEEIWQERLREEQALQQLESDVNENTGLQPENVSAETFSVESVESVEKVSAPQSYRSATATALVRMAEHYLATGSEGARPLSGDKCQLLVHVNLNSANIDTQIEGGAALQFEDGGFLHPNLVRKLACDASIRAVGEDDSGNVTSIGRKSRVIPRKMALALKQRDRGCQYPNCHQHLWTDAHHIKHWADGGETSLDNLITLCRYHHTGLHRGDYQLEKTAAGVRFLNTWGGEIKRVIPNPPHDPDDVVSAIEASHAQQGITITPRTAVTRWAGEGMDYSIAIDHLFRRDAPRSD